jgi:quinol monooxygenase YgiN
MKFRTLLITFILAFSTIGAVSTSYGADVRMFVRHDVSDFNTWKKQYDAFRPMQRKHGVFHQEVFQSTDDPNSLTVIHDFHSVEKARAFAALPELKEIMEKAGVKGPPQIWYATKAGK